MNYTFEPTDEDIKKCHDLETEYADTRRYGSEDGFFIKVESIDIYHRLRDSGNLLVVKDGPLVVGFILMIPPDDSVMHRLFDSGFMEWYVTNDYNAKNCAWIAKIAVNKSYKKQGIGSGLLRRIFEKYGSYSVITTTALYPVRNKAIEATLKSVNMERKGVFVSSIGVNTLWGS